MLLAAAVLFAGPVWPADAQVTETVLHAFEGGRDGLFPIDTLLADTTGPGGALRALYGTTGGGGNTNNCSGGCGTVFTLKPPAEGQTVWTKSVLWNFSGFSTGFYPVAALASSTGKISSETTLFGTTAAGGSTNCFDGCGTVFAVTGRTLTTIWTFSGNDGDAYNNSYGSLVVGKDGTVYGDAVAGGSGGCGLVFVLTPPGAAETAWTQTILWTFTGGSDGCYPIGLIADAAGALYGAAAFGGSNNCGGGCGTVFKLIPPGNDGQTAWTEETIYTFLGAGDGSEPISQLTAGKKGELYGATNSGNGAIFELTPPAKGETAWTEQTLYAFSGGSDGAYPFGEGGALIIDKGGALFGTTTSGGSSDSTNPFCQGGACGTVFRLTPPQATQTAWTETTLWTFTGGTDGAVPSAGLVADNSGALYGTAEAGGDVPCTNYGYVESGGCGVVFRLTGTGYVP